MKDIFLILVCLFVSFDSLAEKRKSVSPQLKTELLKVFTLNEQLHQAFFDYEKQKKNLPAIATQLRQAIEEISNSEVKKLLKFSQAKLKDIKAESPKSDNDQRYHLVSMALIHILNKYDIGDDYNAYSCPMVKKKWIQNSTKVTKVHNPYMSEMPHCGSQDSEH